MKTKQIAACLALVLPMSGLAVAAQGENDAKGSAGPAEADFFGDLPVVLSVSRLQQNQRDVPGFVTVIDAETIRHSGARDLAELLRAVPGFQVAFNAYGAPVAGYHGMTNDVPKGLQVLIDGRTQYSTLAEGGVAWNVIDISLEDIERIEVLRGSNSPAYGSNAFMGVVNVITRHTAETRGVLAKVANGNQGIQDRYARIGFGEGAWKARLTVESARDDGEPRFYDSRETERYNLRVDGDLSSGDSLRLLSGLTRVTLGRGYAPGASATDQIINPHRPVRLDSGFAQLNWHRHWGEAGDTELQGYRVRQSMEDFYKIAIFGLATDFDNSGDATRNDFELQHTVDLGALRLVGGGGWRKDTAEHAYMFGRGREVSQTIRRLFGQAEWRPSPTLTTNLGATVEHDSLSGKSVSPRAAVNIHASRSQTLKLVVGKSRRLPTLFEARSDERLYETVGALAPLVPVGTLLNVGHSSSGTVQPETVLSKEVGYFGDFRAVGLTLDARWFRESLKSRIQSYQVPISSGACPVFEDDFGTPQCEGNYDDFFNVIDAKIRGWESEIAWQPTRTTRLGLAYTRVEIDATWSSTTRPMGAVEAGTVTYLARSSPRHSTSFTLRQRFLDRFTLAAAYYDVSSFKWTQNGNTDAYRRLDWRAAYDFRLAAAKAELAWTVRNDGSDHAEWWSRNGSGDASGAELIGTRHFVSLRVEY